MRPKNAKPTESDARAILIAGWLAKFNDVHDTYGKSLEKRPSIFDAFESGTNDIPLSDLQFAFEEWNRVGTKFPSPGDIRGLLTDRDEAIDQYESEKSFAHVRWLVHFFSWTPDNGFLPLFVGKETGLTKRVEEAATKTEYNGGWLLRPKPLDQRTQFAVDQIGGMERIATLPAGNEFEWARKGFLSAHRRYSETAGYTKIGRAEAQIEAKQLIQGLQERIGK